MSEPLYEGLKRLAKACPGVNTGVDIGPDGEFEILIGDIEYPFLSTTDIVEVVNLFAETLEKKELLIYSSEKRFPTRSSYDDDDDDGPEGMSW